MSKSACEVCGRCLGSICKVYEGGLKNDLKNEDDPKDEDRTWPELTQPQFCLFSPICLCNKQNQNLKSEGKG